MSSTPSQQDHSVDGKPSYRELLTTNKALMASVQSHSETLQSKDQDIKKLKARIAWFEKQFFGSKSERRIEMDNPHQVPLEGLLGEQSTPEPAEEKQTITYQRGKGKKRRDDDCVTDTGLRFGEQVPVVRVDVPTPELEGPDADQYEVISENVQHRLAQRPASYEVIEYRTQVVKKKSSGEISGGAMPSPVLDRTMADVSVLAGLMIDKFQYHLPLYRQHQRIQQAGITLSRSVLTNWVKRSIDLLKPIVSAQLQNMLLSKVLAMDETAIKAGRAKGKMKAGWFWPVMSEDEIVFTYSSSRGRQQIEKLLDNVFEGTLISDGYAAYARYVAATEQVTHAQCWVHTRRQFIEAEASSPDQVAEILALIRELYWLEEKHQKHKLEGEDLRSARLTESQAIVKKIFAWCETQLQSDLLPDDDLIKAVNYTLKRKDALQVFIENPDVPLDTNHLERQIRAIPMGKKNWIFAWTELGAEHIGIIQSLICTCKLQGIDPYDYLVDVLQRVSLHPAKGVMELTPKVWKEKFADKPLRSVIDCRGQ